MDVYLTALALGGVGLAGMAVGGLGRHDGIDLGPSRGILLSWIRASPLAARTTWTTRPGPGQGLRAAVGGNRCR